MYLSDARALAKPLATKVRGLPTQATCTLCIGFEKWPCPRLPRRPHEAGEVVTQPYNALLLLASLAEHASGVVLTYNDELAAACQQKLSIQRPAFADLNAVAARSLASLLLPATQRQAPEVGAAAAATRPQPRGSARGGARAGRPAWDSSPAEAAPARQQPAPSAGAWDGTFGSGSRWGDDEAPAAGNAVGRTLDPLADVCGRLCSQPPYRLLSLRSCPQLPPSSFDFTPFSWPNVLKELKQAQQAGGAAAGAGLGSTRHSGNRSLASLLVLRSVGMCLGLRKRMQQPCMCDSTQLCLHLQAPALTAKQSLCFPCPSWTAGATRRLRQMCPGWQTPPCSATAAATPPSWQWQPAAAAWAGNRCWQRY